MMVKWTALAKMRLDGILDTIARERGVAVAERWQRKIYSVTLQLQMLPLIGAEVQEFGREDIREVGVPPYRVVYCLSCNQCVILTVLHSRQSLSADEL